MERRARGSSSRFGAPKGSPLPAAPAEVAGTADKPGLKPAAMVAMAVALALIPVWIVLAAWASPHMRGSDQYWYVEDVRTVMTGGTQTHEVYPFSLIGVDQRFTTSRPFVHNVPVLYVWAGAASLLGGDPHTGILVVNILGALGAAGFVYLAARRFLSRLGSLATAVLLLYMPVFFWLATQDLAEMFSALLVALAIYLVVRMPKNLLAYMGAAVAVALCAAGRLWTLPFLFLLPLGLVVLDAERPLGRRLQRAALALLVGVVAYVPLAAVFVSYIPALDPMALLLVLQGAKNNMVLAYATTTPPRFDAVVLVRELGRAIVEAVRSQLTWRVRPYTITRWLPLADEWPANLAVLLAFSGLFVRRSDCLRRWVMVLAVLAFGMQLAMSVLFLNEPRYLVPLLPAIVLGAAVASGLWWKQAERRTWAKVAIAATVVATLAAFGAVNGRNAIDYRSSAITAETRLKGAIATIDPLVPAGAKVALDTRFGDRWLADAAIYPRPELALGTDFGLTDAQYLQMVRLFKPRYVVADGTSPLPRLTHARLLGKNRAYSVWEVPPSAWQVP